MIEFSDLTLRDRQAKGNYDATVQLMKLDGAGRTWMLRTEAIITLPSVAFRFLLHFWSDGNVTIIETDHPPIIDVPDDDIRYLSEWCIQNGWKQLAVQDGLLNDPRGFDFWMRLYRAGIITNSLLRTHEAEETERFQKAYEQHTKTSED